MKLHAERLAGCPICGSGDFRRLLAVPDHESGTGEYGIDECAACGVAFTNPRPLESELPRLYEQRSTADFPHMNGPVQQLRDRTIDRYLAAQLGETPGHGETGFRALDFGCGDGALARGLQRWARARTVGMSITAVDFHDDAPAALAASDGDVAYRSRDDWGANPGTHDAIFLRHVLEHHPRPLDLLRELGAALRPRGRLFIEVPNRRSTWARVFGAAYSGYYVPRHLVHFDPASLRTAIERAGLVCAAQAPGHTPLIGRSLGYLGGWDLGNTGVPGLACYPLQVLVDVLAGTSSTLRAVAARDG